MNADHLVVVDVATRAVVADLPGFDRVHPVDARTLAVVARIGGMTHPDGLAYVSSVRRVFVSDEHGAADVVVDAATNRLVATLPLGGKAGTTVFDVTSGQVLVAVHGRNELAVIAPAATVVQRIALPGLDDPHGIALDAAHHVAFVAGEGRRVTGTYPVARGPDVLAFDPGWRRLYVAAESGALTVFQATAADAPDAAPATHQGTRAARGVALARQAELALPHAHTVAVDPRTHLVDLPLENADGAARRRIVARTAPDRRRGP